MALFHKFRIRQLVPLCITVLTIGAGVGCGSDSTSPQPTNVSLAGNYVLQSFVQGGTDLSAVSTGTAVLTDSTYAVNIAFLGNIAPTIIDSGKYVAKSNGTFSETSAVTGAQSTGTYTVVDSLWSVSVTSQGVAISQTWIKQP